MISADLTREIADRVEAQGLDEQSIASLRAAYPGVHFTYCTEDDIHAGTPVLERSGFKVYLVDGREHCLRLTGDPEVATGLVLAEVLDED